MRLYAPFLLMFCLVATPVIAENSECVVKDFNADCLDFIFDAQKCKEKGEQKGKLRQGRYNSSTIQKRGGTEYKTQKYGEAPGSEVLENEIKDNAYGDCHDAIKHACAEYKESCGPNEKDPCKRDSATGPNRTKVVLDKEPKDKDKQHKTTVTCSGFCAC